MALFNQRDAYGFITQAFHWLLSLLILGLLLSGKYSDSLSINDKSNFLIGAHKQIGMAVLVLMAFRLLWRLINSSIESNENKLLHFVAYLTHWLMYFLVFAQAMSGVIMTQMSKRAVFFFDVWEVPSFIKIGESALEHSAVLVTMITDEASPVYQMRAMHDFFGTTLIVLVIAHVAGALLHHFVLGDEVLRRMMFGYKPAHATASKAKEKIMRNSPPPPS